MRPQPAARPTSWHGEIPRVPPSANVFMRMNRWKDQGKLKGEWYLEVYAAFAPNTPEKAEGKRRVTVIVRSKNLRDDANQYLAVDKLILDNLRTLGWIVDDSPKWIDLKVTGEVGQPRTFITLEDLP